MSLYISAPNILYEYDLWYKHTFQLTPTPTTDNLGGKL